MMPYIETIFDNKWRIVPVLFKRIEYYDDYDVKRSRVSVVEFVKRKYMVHPKKWAYRRSRSLAVHTFALRASLAALAAFGVIYYG